MRRAERAIWLALAAALLAVACAEPLDLAPPPMPAPRPLPDPALPHPAGRLAPAQTAAEPGVSGGVLSDVESCSTCHADVFAQQQASAHALSSFNNPTYRVSVEGVRRKVGRRASRMCAGCHDVALLVDGAMDAAIEPGDRRAHAGVTCRVCHGITKVRRDGNGSFVLRAAPLPLPVPGDAASLARHRRAAAPIRSAELCVSCHRDFLGKETGNDHFLPGIDEPTDWIASAYSGNSLARIDEVTPRDCIGCHMPRERATRGDAAAAADGTIASHRFAGGNTWLAAMQKDAAELAADRRMLEGAASIDVAGVRVGERWTLPADGAALAAGDVAVLDVVIRNLSVGHRFPGGVLDAQDTFVAVEVRDASGALLAEAGRDHLAGRADASAHVLRALVADEDGAPVMMRDVQQFRATVVNHTIGPRDAKVVRYRLRVPDSVALPLTVTARLLHRSRNLAIARRSCAETRSRRGRAFRAAGRPIDGCAAPPITEVARTVAVLGGPAPAAARPAAERLYDLGLALTHALQEQLDEARTPLLAALERIGDDPARGRDRARVMAQLAVVAGRQGRTDEALEWVERAEAALGVGWGESPPLAQIRGAALSRVWRWREAAAALAPATRGAPKNPAGWRAYAVALGSLGEHRRALAAARRGLAVVPRDPDMLRVQAVSLRSLGAPEAVADRALRAYDEHRRPDRAPDIRIDCARASAACDLERRPVHVHELRRMR